ncbi:peptidase S24/S26A/S26B/S26C [Thermothelomyces heterothallicus CBS 202.75]|uniref:peptidase S24/S26A/S26B/S26C n=1 Tax=Thermothelomyces heterothallicus CBS 202.75 TaxID=1149848 RepID=UPI0037435A91
MPFLNPRFRRLPRPTALRINPKSTISSPRPSSTPLSPSLPSPALSSSTNATSNPNPHSHGSSKGKGRPGGEPSWLGHPFRVILATLKFVAFAHLLWEYVISMAPASGPSMLPTFEVLGEWLLVSKLHRFGRGVAVGDVVAYNIPINDEVGVKRVLGLPGDYVLMDTPDGGGVAGGGGGGPSMIQVPKGHCWIVGDNLVASRDSRYFGPVPLGLIRGKVIATVRPFSEFKWITNPLRKASSPSDD